MRGAIYARVSTKAQAEEGSSLESQVERCLKWAQAKDFEVPPGLIFREDWSGATLDRPELNQVRTLVRDGSLNVVICYSTDRLSRNPVHTYILAEECQKHNVALAFVTEPLDTSPEGQLIQYVKGYAALIEREKIADRTTRGKQMRARQGRLPVGNGNGLYGYSYVPGKGPGEGIRRVNEAEAENVRMVFRWLVDEGATLYRICVRLTEAGIPAPKGGSRWGISTVARLLRNEAYAGVTFAFKSTYVEPKNPIKRDRKHTKTSKQLRPREDWIELPGVTPPIISRETFQAAQEQLRRNFERADRNRKEQYLLAGHLRCGKCGRAYNGRKTRGHTYYQCAGKNKTVSFVLCPARRLYGKTAEKLVWEEVKRVLSDPRAIIEELRCRQETPDLTQERAKELKKKLSALDQQGQRTVTLYSRTEVDDAWVDREMARITREREKARAELLQQEALLKQSLDRKDQLEAIEQYCATAAVNLESFGYEEKRQALETLNIHVIVDDDGLRIEGIMPVAITSLSSR